MSKKELAAQYHASGCNCAMAVGCAFCDKAGVDEDEMKALVRRYGGGAFKYCGALLGAVAARLWFIIYYNKYTELRRMKI